MEGRRSRSRRDEREARAWSGPVPPEAGGARLKILTKNGGYLNFCKEKLKSIVFSYIGERQISIHRFTPVPQETQMKMQNLYAPGGRPVCPHCGFENQEQNTFCGGCGAVVSQGGIGNPVEKSYARSRYILAGLILVMAAGSLAYRFLNEQKLEQTAALFIGLPALLALALSLTPRAGSARGMIMKGLTIALLMSGVLLAEGIICILMAAPLFYLVGLLIGWRMDVAKNKALMRCVLVLAVLPLAMEGVNDSFSMARDETVVIEETYRMSALQFEENLGKRMAFHKPLPAFLRAGFPRPVQSQGQGLQVGARRMVRFAGGEGKPGNLEFQVVERGPGLARFRFTSDRSHIAHWLNWREAVFTWHERSPGVLEVRLQLSFERVLDPYWYFAPLERYGVSLAGGYVLEHLSPGME